MSNARNLARLIVDSGGDLDAGNLGNAPNPINAGTIAYLGMSTAPTGWLKANGATISRSTYADLFAAIGTTYGAGDGSTTFNIPDLRGEFVRGFDDGRGADSGRGFGSYQGDEFRSHGHDIMNGANAHNAGLTTGPLTRASSGNVRNTNAVYDYGGSETRPRNVALLACIKY